jgi:penicillin-binding protein 1A
MTGTRAGPGDGRATILEAFKPGTAPPDDYSMFGADDTDPRQPMMPPDYERTILRPGTGGLY